MVVGHGFNDVPVWFKLRRPMADYEGSSAHLVHCESLVDCEM